MQHIQLSITLTCRDVIKCSLLMSVVNVMLNCDNFIITVDSRYLELAYLGITAYLAVKIWSLPKHENLTTVKKILWKRGEIAPKEQFLLFSTIFSIYFFHESNYIYIC